MLADNWYPSLNSHLTFVGSLVYIILLVNADFVMMSIFFLFNDVENGIQFISGLHTI